MDRSTATPSELSKYPDSASEPCSIASRHRSAPTTSEKQDMLPELENASNLPMADELGRGAPATLRELAEEFGVSRERVRQIEVSAFVKVHNAVKRRVAAMATPGAFAGR
jgi:hypothetical protein